MDIRLYLAVFAAALFAYALGPLLPAPQLGLPLGLDQGLVVAVVAVVLFALIDRFML